LKTDDRKWVNSRIRVCCVNLIVTSGYGDRLYWVWVRCVKIIVALVRVAGTQRYAYLV